LSQIFDLKYKNNVTTLSQILAFKKNENPYNPGMFIFLTE